MRRLLVLIPLVRFALPFGVLSACAGGRATLPEAVVPLRGDPVERALAAIDSLDLAAMIAELASDAYEGRGTGTPGEQRTIEYVAARMRALGLSGGAPDGSFFQRVPLRGTTPVEVSPLTLRPASGEPASFAFVDGFIATTDQETEAARFDDAELVFVGYGITNPGYDWDDYAGADVRGKVVVMFVNDPPATPEEPALFQADTMTYNGRWTYKYEEARRRGALGALLVHTDATAGYPFTVLSGDARGEHLGVVEPLEGALALRGWITRATAERLAQMSSSTLEAWFAEAGRRGFRARELPVHASLAMTFAQRRGVEGTNVIGRLPGAVRPGEGIIYTAHHDHLGRSAELEAEGRDGIFNGATDNASGVAMLLEVAEAFATLPDPPARSVYFATLTAEEAGLLGSQFLAEHPPIPLARMVANVNVDSGNMLGRTEDIVGIGAERSEMLRYFREAAAEEGLTVSFDLTPGAGRFFRSDQLAFARGGVPAVFISTGRRFVGRDPEFAMRAEADYRQNRYHQPSDEWTGTAPLAGLVQQTRVAFRLGHRLATTDLRPTWRPSEPFSATRAASERAEGLRD